MTPTLHLLSLLDDPPEWVLWVRPAREDEGCDVVVTLDLDTDASPTAGQARVGHAVAWMGERRPSGVACWSVERPGEGATAGGYVAWLRDIRRDLRRRHDRHGTTYTVERVHVLDERRETHRRRANPA
jgi:hypothetical protein